MNIVWLEFAVLVRQTPKVYQQSMISGTMRLCQVKMSFKHKMECNFSSYCDKESIKNPCVRLNKVKHWKFQLDTNLNAFFKAN